MPDSNETENVARKLLPIIYVIDASGSMSDYGKISVVNEAMNETVDVLKDVSKANPDAELEVGVLRFATGAEWVTNGLAFVDDFFWTDIEAGGLTDLGAAIEELSDKLSRSKFLTSEIGYKLPNIILMSDGGPTDDWKPIFDKAIATNTWFKYANKICVAVGDDADRDVLGQFAGNPEAVIDANDNETLKKLIVVASATMSKIGSVSHSTDQNLQQQMIDEIKREVDPEGAAKADATTASASAAASDSAPASDQQTDPWPAPDLDDPWGSGKWN